MAKPLPAWSVYVLKDPRSMQIRYVGWTVDPRRRFNGHLIAARLGKDRTHKANWVRSLLRENLQPVMEVVETGSGDPSPVEISWIAKLREQGCRLTNRTDGGDGTAGLIISEETRRKQSEAHIGYVITESQRQAMSRAHKALPMTAERLMRLRQQAEAMRARRSTETYQKIAAAKRGRKHSEEHKQKISAGNLGKKMSEESKRKSSVAALKRVSTPEGRCQLLAAIQKAIATPRDPERERLRREKISASVRARWADPGQRLAFRKGIQKVWDERKANAVTMGGARGERDDRLRD